MVMSPYPISHALHRFVFNWVLIIAPADVVYVSDFVSDPKIQLQYLHYCTHENVGIQQLSNIRWPIHSHIPAFSARVHVIAQTEEQPVTRFPFRDASAIRLNRSCMVTFSQTATTILLSSSLHYLRQCNPYAGQLLPAPPFLLSSIQQQIPPTNAKRLPINMTSYGWLRLGHMP